MTNRLLEDDEVKQKVIELSSKMNNTEVSKETGVPRRRIGEFLRRDTYRDWWESYVPPKEFQGPKILFIDIETAPTEAKIWSQFANYIPLDMVEKEWFILSFAAKWAHSDEMIYEDKSSSWDDEDDRELVASIWSLLDEADIVIGHNSKRFDVKKINWRILKLGMSPYSSIRQVDTLEETGKNFAPTSKKLLFLTDEINTVYKKLDHGRFAGYKLWKECLRGNEEAWSDMADYNKYDVLSLEEYYFNILPWMKSHPNINLYYDDNKIRCRCGSEHFSHNGYVYTNLAKYDRFTCDDCGAEQRGRVNLLSKAKRQTLMGNIT